MKTARLASFESMQVGQSWFWLWWHALLLHFKRLCWFLLKRRRKKSFYLQNSSRSLLQKRPLPRSEEVVSVPTVIVARKTSFYLQNSSICIISKEASQRPISFQKSPTKKGSVGCFGKRRRERCFDSQDSSTCIISEEASRAVFISKEPYTIISKEPYKIISKEPYKHLHQAASPIVFACTASWEVEGWGRDPKKCTGRVWGMGSSTI